jgi:hypothetical protein
MSYLLIDKKITKALEVNAASIRELKGKLEHSQQTQEILLHQYRCDHDFVALQSYVVSIDRCTKCNFEWLV